MPQPLLVQLRKHAAEQEEERKAAGELWHEGDWLFTDQLGKPLHHRTDLAHWKQLLADAGVHDARLHDARHTAATVLLELGVSDRAAMQLMGCSNAALPQRYQHVTGTVLDSVAEKISTHLWNEPDEWVEKPHKRIN